MVKIETFVFYIPYLIDTFKVKLKNHLATTVIYELFTDLHGLLGSDVAPRSIDGS